MKRLVFSLFVIGFMLAVMVSAQNKKEVRPLGLWKMVEAFSGGEQVSQEFTNRTMFFSSDNKFASMMKIGDQELIFNQGLYQMYNDSIIVMFHADGVGNLHDIANTYVINISDDKMYFWGYYMAGDKAKGYVSKFLEEWWVKVKEK